MRLVYSVLWASTYDNWWDVWFWSHLWTDIATAKWTPVYAIWKWKIITAKNLQWRWNTVVIRHDFDGKYIYSAYAHMDKITVSANEDIEIHGEIIYIFR
jgi:murein DD-endopeptidase MepM/ murein hydrolase activator NlpD